MAATWLSVPIICLVTLAQLGCTEQNNQGQIFSAILQDDIKILGDQSMDQDPSLTAQTRTARKVDAKQLDACEELLGADSAGASKYAKAGELYLPKDYNKLERPKGMLFGEVIEISTPVKVHMSIRKISDIDEINEQITFEMDMTIEWLDAGLLTNAFEDEDEDANLIEQAQKVLDPSFLRRIWKPDIFIENLVQVSVPDIIGAPAKLQFSPSGLVTFTTRVRVKIECDFDFTYYPADTQRCEILLRSYSHNSSAVELKWRRPAGVYLQNPDDPNFDVAVGAVRRFRLAMLLDHTKSTNETFDCLQFTIFIRRRLSYHFAQTYSPSILFLTITWMCFMIPKTHAEVRMGIVMTTLLTLTSMFASVRETGPVVSYPKAIDYWMTFSIQFVFLILLHFALLYWAESSNILHRKERLHGEPHVQNHRGTELRVINSDMHFTDFDENICPESDTKFGFPSPAVAEKRFKAAFLRNVARLVCVVETNSLSLSMVHMFGFVTIYWAWLLIYSGYYQWYVNVMHNAVGDDVNSQGGITELKPF